MTSYGLGYRGSRITEQMVYSERANKIEQDPRSLPLGEVQYPLCIKLLGGFEISVGPRALKEDQWRLRKAASLVKLLALAPGHYMHREQIMDLLWPDLNPRAAANNLRYALYNARRTLGSALATASGYLHFRDGLLALCPEGPFWTDVEAFEGAADAARGIQDLAVYERAVRL